MEDINALPEPSQRIKRSNNDTLEWESPDAKKNTKSIELMVTNITKSSKQCLDSIPYAVLAIMLTDIHPKSVESYLLRSTCPRMKWVLEQYMHHPLLISTLLRSPIDFQIHVDRLPKVNVDIVLSLQLNALYRGDWNSFSRLYGINDCLMLENANQQRLCAVIGGDHVECLKKLAPLIAPKQDFYQQVFLVSALKGAIKCIRYAIAFKGNVQIIGDPRKILTIAGANQQSLCYFDYVGINGCALHYAVMHGQIEMAKFIFSKVAKDSAEHADFALMSAVTCGHLELAKYFCLAGADVTVCNNICIAYAAKTGRLEMVEYLYSFGVNISANEDKAICLAAEAGHLQVVALLVSLGANIQARDNKCLYESAINSHIDIVKYLISCGAKTPQKTNLMHAIAEHGNLVEIEQYLSSVWCDMIKPNK